VGNGRLGICRRSTGALTRDPSLSPPEPALTWHPLALRQFRYRDEATAALSGVATDASTVDEDRLRTAVKLAYYQGEHAVAAVKVLTELTASSDVSPLERALAEGDLVVLARSGERGLQVHADLGRLTSDRALSVDQRRKAAEKLDRVGTQHHRAAVLALRALIVGVERHASDRRAAAEALMDVLDATGRIVELPLP
jgi:hypothetical protein